MPPKRSASMLDDSDSSDGGAPTRVVKKNKSTEAASNGVGSGPVADGKDADGNPFWELSGKRRAAVSKFGGRTYLNIREFYEKDGKTLPGKKGISLSMDQYRTLLRILPAINESLQSMGESVDGVDDEAAPKKRKKAKETSASRKSNIEATSDEED